MGTTIEELINVPGRLNPEAVEDTEYRNFTSNTTGFGTLAKIIAERFERKVGVGVSQWKAIVYKVVSRGPADPSETPEQSPSANQRHITGQDTPNPVVIKACIPEEHGWFIQPTKLPKKNGDIDAANLDIIDQFPEFTARVTDTNKAPEPGDIVWVTFTNLENKTGGIYLGPIHSETRQIKVKFKKQKAIIDEFKKKCRFCTVAPKGEDLALAQHNIDWKSNQLVHKEEIDVSSAIGTVPFGKGLFSESTKTSIYKPGKARDAQISWIALQIKNKNLNIKSIQKAIKAYHKEGIRVYLHAKPERGKNEVFIKNISSLMTGQLTEIKNRNKEVVGTVNLGAPIGFLIDFTDYLAGSTNTAATIAPAAALWKNLYNLVKTRGHSIGFTIKDIKNSNDRVRTGLPYSTFATGDYQADFSVIQWEWIMALAHSTPGEKNIAATRRAAAFENAYTVFRALNFKNIIPALSANRFYTTDPAMKVTGKEMRLDALTMFVGHPAGQDPIIKEQANAVIWDDWAGAQSSKKGGWTEKRWEILEEFGNLTKRAEKLNSLDQDTSMDASQKILIQQLGLEGLMTGIVAEFDDFAKVGKRGSRERRIWKDNVFLPKVPWSSQGLALKQRPPTQLWFFDYKEEYYDALTSVFANPPDSYVDDKGKKVKIKSTFNISPATFTIEDYLKLGKKRDFINFII